LKEPRANDLDGTNTDGGELTHSYSVESGREVKMTKPRSSKCFTAPIKSLRRNTRNELMLPIVSIEI
jgi:hypothetical protein